MRPLTQPDLVIACAGNRVDSRCAEAMERVASLLPYVSLRFVNSIWLVPSELATVMIYWVVDVELPAAVLEEVLKLRFPLLVPRERSDLTIQRDSACCYTYGTANEAAEKIVWILGHGRSGHGWMEQSEVTLRATAATVGDR